MGGITLGVYALLAADFVLCLCRAYMPGAEGDGAGAADAYLLVPFVVFAVCTVVQAVCLYGIRMPHVYHVIIAFAKAILALFFTWLMGYPVLRASFYQASGITEWGSLSCPVYATIFVSVYIALTFICAACEIIYVMRLNMEENMAKRQAEAAAETAAEGPTAEGPTAEEAAADAAGAMPAEQDAAGLPETEEPEKGAQAEKAPEGNAKG